MCVTQIVLVWPFGVQTLISYFIYIVHLGWGYSALTYFNNNYCYNYYLQGILYDLLLVAAVAII